MNGIDVSHYQGMIDWHQVANDNVPKVDFAFIKATQGTSYVDNMLKFNAIHATNAGVPVSYYHFATLNSKNVVADALAEADFFISVIKNLPKNTLPVALDIESNKSGLNEEEVLKWISTFLTRIDEHGHSRYYLYSYTPFLNENLPSDHDLGTIPLWIAAYTQHLKLPSGWTKEAIWQYSASGKIKGIHANVDLNKGDTLVV